MMRTNKAELKKRAEIFDMDKDAADYKLSNVSKDTICHSFMTTGGKERSNILRGVSHPVFVLNPKTTLKDDTS